MPDDRDDPHDLQDCWNELGHRAPTATAPRMPVPAPTQQQEAPPHLREYAHEGVMLTNILRDLQGRRTETTLRRDILRSGLRNGLNPQDIPDELWETDDELQRIRQSALDHGFVIPPGPSSPFGQLVLDLALRLRGASARTVVAMDLRVLINRLAGR